MYRDDLIRGAMAAQRKTIAEVARESGVSVDTVNRARNCGNLSIESLLTIAQTLKLDMRDLFTFDEPKAA